jgi:hypothetical protein
MRRVLLAIVVLLLVGEVSGLLAMCVPERTPIGSSQSTPDGCPPGCFRCTNCAQPAVFFAITPPIPTFEARSFEMITVTRLRPVISREIIHVPKLPSA